MLMPGKTRSILFCIVFISCIRSGAQSILNFSPDSAEGLVIESCTMTSGQSLSFQESPPLFSFEIDGEEFSSAQCTTLSENGNIRFLFSDKVTGLLTPQPGFDKAWKVVMTLQNTSGDTLEISNVIPFGRSDDHVFITGDGPWALARAKIFLPGRTPLRVMLPDNAWEMGYASLRLNAEYSVCAIARRTGITDSQQRRYKTIIPPRGSVEYTIYADEFTGEWQNGLKRMFQRNYLFDLEEFDNSLFLRQDLQWIRDKYIIALQFAWDHEFYERTTGRYEIYSFLDEGRELFGGYDVFGIWPTWPRLGVDQRNQWDLYVDLPYGLEKIKEIATYAQSQSTRFFIAYNPWDQSTREEDPYEGMARLIRGTNADGVVLDTRGSSSIQLQNAADSVKPGVVMYSEGMAIPADMPGIVSGRAHNAILMSPVLNLNKLIKPDFSIFRVCDLSDGQIHREVSVSFFNGHGTELNMFSPGRPAWMEEEFKFLGRTTMILRENSPVFLNDRWTPLRSTLKDSVWVNEWMDGNKTLYTVFSLLTEGHSGPLFEVTPRADHHFVSLWNHEELEPENSGLKWVIPARLKEFNKKWLGTRREGSIECVVQFPEILKVSRKGDSVTVLAGKGDKTRIWKGIPSYQGGIYKDFTIDSLQFKISELFGRYEGKLVIQRFNGNELLDERIINILPGVPYLISTVERTRRVKRAPVNMVEIPAGDFIFSVSNPDQFIPYPDLPDTTLIHIDRFFMDKYPVTNEDFYRFLQSSDYRPKDPVNFLDHWENDMYIQGQENYPVVFVSVEDAKAYAEWAGKRLPTEEEWQYAAQGTDGRIWPWGDTFQGTKCNNAFDRATPVDAFPKGKSPFKVEDMVGNIWQMTNDVYDNGSYYFMIIRGGSYYKPTSSQWYVKGGPQPLNQTQMLLLVSPGFDRNATVGFRCVKDVED